MAKRVKASTSLATTADGYADLWKCRTAVSAFTIAVLWALDYVKVSPKGLATKGKKKYHPAVLRALVKSTMVAHWTKAGRLDDQGVTVKGLNEISERLNNPKYSYRTTLAAVQAMREGLEKGTDVEIEGNKFKLGKVVTIGDSLFS